ncbi:23S rRNA pseudouridine(2605) synthase RluB [Neptunicella marina]|uniref:Pseudouridine synthase n=1 Tax=Neptunicella marina TaxID=2125989 RepID=A0A8J6IS98_9ALTE|nr:23S rRNA pseudouridine(2605) synthase RluB [Neptunicella marina]MBC3764666.1 23S rRNA pseudouridine(2605) synthase RluB [Neptunicella marina]
MSEKLQKVLATAGIGSRRQMEEWIQHGRVSVNGDIATLGARVEPGDQIRVDGQLIEKSQQKDVCRVIMYNKPEGEMCTRHDPEGRPTVFDRIPRIRNGRWIAVGRLDINTSGLLLFTNDGELANRLMHPRHEVEREYAVRVFGEVTPETLNTLKNGVQLEDGLAKFLTIRPRVGDDESINQWYNVTLTEGRNREVRRLWESQDLQVSRLIRVRYGNLELQKRLPQGAWIELELKQVNYLRKLVQLPAETETLLDERKTKLDHVRINRMRRSVQKHKLSQKKGGSAANSEAQQASAKPQTKRPNDKKFTKKRPKRIQKTRTREGS